MSKTKKIIISLIIILGIGGVAYGYTQMNNKAETRTEPNSDQQPTSSDKDEQQDAEPSNNEDSEATDKTPVQYSPPSDSSDDENKNAITGVITSKSVQNNNLVIRTNIDGVVSGGTCKLTLSRSSDGKKFTQSVDMINNPSSSSCMGFDVPISKLGDGKWNIVIKLTSSSKSGELKGQVSL